MHILQLKSIDSQPALEVGLFYNMATYLFESTDDIWYTEQAVGSM